MANNLPTKKPNSSLALEKAKSRIDIVNKLLAKKQDDLTAEELNYRLHITKGHSDSVISIAISPDGKYIVSGSDDNTIKLWDISSGKEVRTFGGIVIGLTQ